MQKLLKSMINSVNPRYIQHLGPYAPTLIQPWSWINVSLRLNICKMVRKTELKSRSISY